MIQRKRTLDVFKGAKQCGNYDDVPVLIAEADPQVLLSRNDVPQPFSLTLEKDSVLVQMSGEAQIFFVRGNVRSFDLVAGDHVYVPAGTPHRIVPQSESVQLRYKARNAGLEAASWNCTQCSEELFAVTWDTADSVSQLAYADACLAFNADAKNRRCSACGTIAAPVDLTPFHWDQTGASLRAADQHD